MRDAAVWGTAAIDGTTIAICVMDFGFMGGSMGAVVGEKVTRAAEYALTARIPLVIVSASGGARMQEGTLSLMQLAKTVGAVERLRGSGVPFLSLLSDPTTGGVFASFAVLGDVNIAEPNALIGFAGARVSAATIAQELPPGFQRSEFLFSHGFLDRVIHRSELRAEIATLLRFLVARPVAVGEDGPDGDPLGLPSFRPLSFLSNLAERVLPAEPDDEPATNGHRPAGRPVPAAPSVPISPAPAADSTTQPVPADPTTQPVPADSPADPAAAPAAPASPATLAVTEEADRG
jgi:carboxyltransferase family protein